MLPERKLLLADDSLTIQKVVSLTFSEEGMEVTTVSDGTQALDKLKEISPDILLADVCMPGLNGYELCERLRADERLRHVPVLLLVGTFEPFDDEEARRVGADDVLTKPFTSIKELVNRVGRLLTGRSEGPGSIAEHMRKLPSDEVGSERSAPNPLQKTNESANTALIGHEIREHSTLQVEPDAPAAATTDPRVSLPEITPAEAAESTTPEVLEANSFNYFEEARAPEKSEEEDQTAGDIRSAETSTFESFGHDDTMIEVYRPDEDSGQISRHHDSFHSGLLAASAAARSEEMENQGSQFEQAINMTSESEHAGGDAEQVPKRELEFPQQQSTPSGVHRTEHDDVLDLDDPGVVGFGASEQGILDIEYENLAPSPLKPAEAGVNTSSEFSVNEGEAQSESPRVDEETLSASSEGRVSTHHLTATVPEAEQLSADSKQGGLHPDHLSAEVIDAVAHRVVEYLSDKVIRDIAWEIVPELAELLIKQRLDEENSKIH